jgi:hypothetical protein
MVQRIAEQTPNQKPGDEVQQLARETAAHQWQTTPEQDHAEQMQNNTSIAIGAVVLTLCIGGACILLGKLVKRAQAAAERRRSRLDAREWADREQAKLYQYMREVAEHKQQQETDDNK